MNAVKHNKISKNARERRISEDMNEGDDSSSISPTKARNQMDESAPAPGDSYQEPPVKLVRNAERGHKRNMTFATSSGLNK